MLFAAAKMLSQGRRDGAYELLLTSPLSPNEIVWGTLEALHLHFRALTKFVLAINGLMMLGGLATRHWSKGSLSVYFLVWLFLLAWTWSLGRDWGGCSR